MGGSTSKHYEVTLTPTKGKLTERISNTAHVLASKMSGEDPYSHIKLKDIKYNATMVQRDDKQLPTRVTYGGQDTTEVATIVENAPGDELQVSFVYAFDQGVFNQEGIGHAQQIFRDHVESATYTGDKEFEELFEAARQNMIDNKKWVDVGKEHKRIMGARTDKRSAMMKPFKTVGGVFMGAAVMMALALDVVERDHARLHSRY
jgi:hypothetical protein